MNRHRLIIALFVLTCHAAVLFNRGLYFDAWIINAMAKSGQQEELTRFFSELGFPLFGYVHWALGRSLNGITSYMLVAFGSLLLSALAYYQLLCEARVFSPREALYGALAYTGFTAFQVPFDLAITMYMISVPAFLWAFAGVMRWSVQGRGLPPALPLAGISLLLFLSFHTMSIVPVFAAGLAAGAAARIRSLGFAQALARHGLFWAILASVLALFLVLKFTVWRSYGIYGDYNVPAFDLSLWWTNVLVFAKNSVLWPLTETVAELARHPFVFAGVAALLAAAAYRWQLLPPAGEGAARRRLVAILWIALGAVALFLISILPYCLANKPSRPFGWDTRHALLVNLSVPLLLIAAARLLQAVLPAAGRRIIVPGIGIFLLTGFMLTLWNNYANWYFRYAKDRATIAALRAVPLEEARRFSIVYVTDTARIDRTDGYGFIDYAGIFKAAWGDEARIGEASVHAHNLPKVVAPLPLPRYALSRLRFDNCTAQFKLRFADEMTPITAALAEGDGLSALFSLFTGPGKVRLTTEWIDLSRQRIRALEGIRAAFEAYRAEHGAYPNPEGGKPAVSKPEEWVQLLVPTYLPAVPGDSRRSVAADFNYLYFSDGENYKLIAHGLADAECVIREHPELMDPRRPEFAYGFWTPAAKNW